MPSKESGPSLDIGYRARSAGVLLAGAALADAGVVFIQNIVAHANKNHISLFENDHLIANGIGGAVFAAGAYFGLRGLVHALVGRKLASN